VGKDEDETSFEDMKFNVQSAQNEKIKKICELARGVYKLSYAWVDTCRIDKSSRAELMESINSMFKWYHQAAVCVAFLADWELEDENSTIADGLHAGRPDKNL
jgi:protein tyrosine phosphatase